MYMYYLADSVSVGLLRIVSLGLGLSWSQLFYVSV